jgi:hypothetical protein
MFRNVHPGSGSGSGFKFFKHLGSRGQKDTGSRIRDTLLIFFIVTIACYFFSFLRTPYYDFPYPLGTLWETLQV